MVHQQHCVLLSMYGESRKPVCRFVRASSYAKAAMPHDRSPLSLPATTGTLHPGTPYAAPDVEPRAGRQFPSLSLRSTYTDSS